MSATQTGGPGSEWGHAAAAQQRESAGTAGVVHPVYLPVHRDQLRRHFARVGGRARGKRRQHLRYYENSASLALQHQSEHHSPAAPVTGSGACAALNHQVEKDERFWVAAALMALLHSEDRVIAFTDLLTSAFETTPRLDGVSTWADALAEDEDNPLELFFEVNLPAPRSYMQWLKDHLDERTLPPWIRAKAARTSQLEGATKADAMLIAPKTGFAVVFEAKVLSDASSHTGHDALRNQIARNIDVLLDRNPRLQAPLSKRCPERTCFVLITPEIFRKHPESRLYGHLTSSYRSDPSVLQQHLPHRQKTTVAAMSGRLGWTTFEECDRIRPGACSWLPSASTRAR